jgi:serine/threonine protein kinase
VLHRDLKPSNIKVTPDGQVKVLDFGLAKALDPAGFGTGTAEEDSPTITSPAFTQAGTILGTAAYMAPEQVRGKAVDRRADIWAFGCVLFEMLAGTRALTVRRFPTRSRQSFGANPANPITPVFSADGTWVAFGVIGAASGRNIFRATAERWCTAPAGFGGIRGTARTETGRGLFGSPMGLFEAGAESHARKYNKIRCLHGWPWCVRISY